MKIKRVAVFCGSSSGSKPIYKSQAELLGKKLAEQNIELIYGGAKIGLMGAVADAVLAHGGTAIGIIPEFLKTKEVVHDGLSQLITVDTMQERKSKMFEMSDATIALPGGYGTLEELTEVMTLAQLSQYNKPIAILDIDNYYRDLISFFQTMVNRGFVKQVHLDMLIVNEHVDDLLDLMHAFNPSVIKKWIS